MDLFALLMLFAFIFFSSTCLIIIIGFKNQKTKYDRMVDDNEQEKFISKWNIEQKK